MTIENNKIVADCIWEDVPKKEYKKHIIQEITKQWNIIDFNSDTYYYYFPCKCDKPNAKLKIDLNINENTFVLRNSVILKVDGNFYCTPVLKYSNSIIIKDKINDLESKIKISETKAKSNVIANQMDNAKVEFLQKSFKKKSVIKEEYTVKGPTLIYYTDGRIDTIPPTVAR